MLKIPSIPLVVAFKVTLDTEVCVQHVEEVSLDEGNDLKVKLQLHRSKQVLTCTAERKLRMRVMGY